MYTKILVPIDGSATSICGLNEAVRIAKSQGSQLRLLHIVNEFILDYTYTPGIYANDIIDALREGGKKVLGEAQNLVQQQGIAPRCACVMLETIGGSAADLIIAQAKEWPADLIVMGTHGRRGLRRFAMGSDAESVVRSAPVPVLLVHETAQEPASARLAKEGGKKLSMA